MVELMDATSLALAAVLLPALGGAGSAALCRWRGSGWVAVAGAALGLGAALGAAAAVAGTGPVSRVFIDWIALGGRPVPVSLTVDQLGVAALIAVVGTGLAALLFARAQAAPADGRGAALLAAVTAALALAAVAGTCALAAAGWAVAAAAMYPLLGSTPGLSPRAHRLAGAAQWLSAALLLATTVFAAAQPHLSALAWLTPWGEPAGALADEIGVAGPVGAAAPAARFMLGLIVAAAVVQAGAFPFHAWLIATAEAPASAAAVLHGASAATGLYVLARSRTLFELAPDLGAGLIVAGVTMSLLAALASLASRSLTGGLACATAAQGGLIVPLAAVAAPGAAAAQLLCWGMARGGLYLAAGLVSRSLTTGSRLDGMGGLCHHLRLASWSFLAGAVILAGLPPFAGYWSAGILLAGLGQAHGPVMALLVGGSLVVAGAAPLRLALGAFLGPPRATALAAAAGAPVGRAATVALVMAPALAAVLPLVGVAWWSRSGFAAPAALLAQLGAPGPEAAASPMATAALSALLAWALWRRQRTAPDEESAGHRAETGLLARAWGAQEASEAVGQAVRAAGRTLWTFADTLLAEVAVVGGLSALIRGLGLAVSSVGDGRRTSYAALSLAAVAAALAVALWGTP